MFADRFRRRGYERYRIDPGATLDRKIIERSNNGHYYYLGPSNRFFFFFFFFFFLFFFFFFFFFFLLFFLSLLDAVVFPHKAARC